MNLAYLLLIFFLYNAPSGQLNTTVSWTNDTGLAKDDVIYFDQNRKLVWDDFVGKPPVGDRAAAVTVSGFGYKANVRTNGGSGTLDIKVYCYFHKNKSWVKPGRNTPYILRHEQHHFDISYIAASIFLEKLKGADFTISNYEQLLGEIYNESTEIMNSLQDDYDGETKNGQLREMQAQWNNTVASRISDLTR